MISHCGDPAKGVFVMTRPLIRGGPRQGPGHPAALLGVPAVRQKLREAPGCPGLSWTLKRRVSLLALFACCGCFLLCPEPWRAGGVGWWGAGSPHPAPLQLRSFPRDKPAQPCPRPPPKALTQLTEVRPSSKCEGGLPDPDGVGRLQEGLPHPALWALILR